MSKSVESALTVQIRQWDGKSAEDIKQIYNHYADQPRFANMLIKLMAQEPLQNGSSWLLKKFFEGGGQLGLRQLKSLYNLLPKLLHWQAKLHILQSMPYVPIPNSCVEVVYPFLREGLVDSNKFVRAWAYNGFYELAQQHHQYAEQAKQFFEMALKDEAASVKARIRNLMKNIS